MTGRPPSDRPAPGAAEPRDAARPRGAGQRKAARGAPRVELVVSERDAGLRLDQLLAAHVEGLSRRKARVALDIGAVFVDGARCKVASKQLRAGQRVAVVLGGALERASGVGLAARQREQDALPQPTVVHEDEHLLVVSKPSGLLTAPTPEGDRDTLLTLLSRERALHLVHRLDLATSGLLCFAKSLEASRALDAAFQRHDVERRYLAVLVGDVEGDARTIDLPLRGKRAVTHLEVLERLGGATLARVTLETGRTHQVRLHAASLGHPVAGDGLYGVGARAAGLPPPPRLALHAAVLGLAHPCSGVPLRFEAPLPAELESWIALLRSRVGGRTSSAPNEPPPFDREPSKPAE